jgi:predicted transcriptional regulator
MIVGQHDRAAMQALSGLVLECEDIYPGIDLWFKKKVVPGLSDGSRLAFLVYNGSALVGGAIVKRSQNAKVCNLRIREQFAGRGYGTGLFSLAARAVLPYSSHLHFTAPEELANRERNFFESLGFQLMGALPRQYRRGQAEFSFRATSRDVLRRTAQSVSHDLFGARLGISNVSPWLVFSIQQRYAEQIIRGRKTIELRKRFSRAHRGSWFLVYATKPLGAVVGAARISEVENAHVADIDESTLDRACVDRHELLRYASGCTELWKIHLSDVIPLEEPLSLQLLSKDLDVTLQPPQSFGHAPPGSAWGRVTDILAMSGRLVLPGVETTTVTRAGTVPQAAVVQESRSLRF